MKKLLSKLKKLWKNMLLDVEVSEGVFRSSFKPPNVIAEILLSLGKSLEGSGFGLLPREYEERISNVASGSQLEYYLRIGLLNEKDVRDYWDIDAQKMSKGASFLIDSHPHYYDSTMALKSGGTVYADYSWRSPDYWNFDLDSLSPTSFINFKRQNKIEPLNALNTLEKLALAIRDAEWFDYWIDHAYRNEVIGRMSYRVGQSLMVPQHIIFRLGQLTPKDKKPDYVSSLILKLIPYDLERTRHYYNDGPGGIFGFGRLADELSSDSFPGRGLRDLSLVVWYDKVNNQIKEKVRRELGVFRQY